MKLVTYATHSEGTFDELVNCGYPIKVLGWGTKWTGFMDKFRAIREYLDDQPDDELVVFLDGFDSKVNRDLSDLERVFESMNCEVLVSRDRSSLSSFLPDVACRYITQRVFGTCQGGHTANTGLYMGRASELKKILDSIDGGTDDQREFNQACSDSVRVDVENVIFENCSDQSCQSQAFFVQYPGSLTVNRVARSVKEYSAYFIPELLLVIILTWWFFWAR